MQEFVSTIFSIIQMAWDSPLKLLSLTQKTISNIPLEVIRLIGFLFVMLYVVSLFKKMWKSAQPNQWMLIIKDGKLKKAGIGLASFVFPNQTFVKFPSLISKVSFSAQNITKQMQGVRIEGFAFWSVHREGQGPFKCYKYMQGGNANNNVKTMCESIIRNTLANCQLESVLRDRNILRDGIIKQLAPQLKGWGIWLETVQLTQVKICSKTLFEDLQAEFRQQAHMIAQQKRILANQKLKERQLQSSIKMKKIEQQAKTIRLMNEYAQKIRRQQQETKSLEENNNLKIIKLQSEKQLTLQRIDQKFTEQKQRLLNDLQRKSKRKDIQLQNIKNQIENDKLHTPQTLEKYSIDAIERGYKKISNIKQLKINKFVDSNSLTNNFFSLLPGLQQSQLKSN